MGDKGMENEIGLLRQISIGPLSILQRIDRSKYSKEKVGVWLR